MKKILLIALAVFTVGTSFAQNTPARKKSRKSEKRERINALLKMEEEGEIIFRKHSIFGFKLATDGLGILYEKGKYKSNRKTSIWQIEFNEKYHPKEEKQSTQIDIFGNVSQAKFGKANNFFQLKYGMGQQYRIGGKANKNGVAVSALWLGGIGIGLIKPYYVDLRNSNGNYRYKFEDTLSTTGGQNEILGASGFTVGWDEVKIKPGVHAKGALRFDFGKFNETVTAIEAGLNFEFYSSKIVQMSFQGKDNKEKQFFFNAYVAIELGKRK